MAALVGPHHLPASSRPLGSAATPRRLVSPRRGDRAPPVQVRAHGARYVLGRPGTVTGRGAAAGDHPIAVTQGGGAPRPRRSPGAPTPHRSQSVTRAVQVSPGPETKGRTPMEHAIQVSDVAKTYPLGAGEVVAVDHLSLDIAQGEFVAVVGRSGSGKTTLLNLLAGIDRPTSGTIHAAGADLGSLSESGLAAWRGRNVGLVFQFFQLLPTLTVVENVMLPMDFAKQVPPGQRRP